MLRRRRDSCLAKVSLYDMEDDIDKEHTCTAGPNAAL